MDMVEHPMCLPRVTTEVVNRTGRLEFMYASLLATRKVFNVYTSVPIERLSSVCFTMWAQFNHSLLNGVKLLASEADSWDVQQARSILNFHDILHRQVEAMEGIISMRSRDMDTAMVGKDVFTRFFTKIRHALRWYESSQTSGMEAQGLCDISTEPNGSLVVADPGEPLPVYDDTFWQTLFDDNWMLVGDGLGT